MKTAEFVSPMHPDKICDRISDAILDECLKQDPNSRVAVEVLGGHKKLVLIGEVTTQAEIDFKKIILNELNDSSFEIIINITKQSTSIAQGVDIGGAGDQGIMVGYACLDTKNLMPLGYELSRSLCKYIFQFHPYDGKTQITIDDENKITDIVVSFQNVLKSDLKTLTLDWLKLENINNCNNLKF
jgi:S-adenosylmethionine synthetase